MAEGHTLHGRRPTVRVSGELLKRDRTKLGHSQESFSAACGSVSLATVRRAEQGHRIMFSAIKAMSETLGQPIDRYVVEETSESGQHSIASRFAGEWLCLNVGPNSRGQPFVLETDVYIAEKNGTLSGSTQVKNYSRHASEQYTEQYDEIGISGNLFIATYHVRNSGRQTEPGAEVVKAYRNGQWLEGFSSWYDADTDRIENSRVIFVQKSGRLFDEYLAEAKEHMKQEVAIFRVRKLIETGYSFEEAVGMMLAVSDR